PPPHVRWRASPGPATAPPAPLLELRRSLPPGSAISWPVVASARNKGRGGGSREGERWRRGGGGLWFGLGGGGCRVGQLGGGRGCLENRFGVVSVKNIEPSIFLFF